MYYSIHTWPVKKLLLLDCKFLNLMLFQFIYTHLKNMRRSNWIWNTVFWLGVGAARDISVIHNKCQIKYKDIWDYMSLFSRRRLCKSNAAINSMERLCKWKGNCKMYHILFAGSLLSFSRAFRLRFHFVNKALIIWFYYILNVDTACNLAIVICLFGALYLTSFIQWWALFLKTSDYF